MNIKFQIITVLKTIFTKVPRSRSSDVQRIIQMGCAAMSLLFAAIGIYSFWNMDDLDGLLDLGLALLFLGGAFLKKQLIRQGRVSLVFCVLLILLMAGSLVLGEHIVLNAMMALLMPIILLEICGIQYGMLMSAGLVLFFAVLFFSPVRGLLHGACPAELQVFYPVLFGIVCLVYYRYSYYRHKEQLDKCRNEETLEKAVRAEHNKLMAMTTQTILSISNAVDTRDSYTKRHSSRVAEYSVLLAKAIGWDSARLEQLYNIALLHDIGKIGISDAILNKHAALNDEEYETIKKHTVIGSEILKDLTLLPNASIGAVSHHERFDGHGYPYGLKGGQIPIEARIIGIADAFDAMNSSRVYRTKMAPTTILQELRRGSGNQFDPELLEKFLPIAEQILQSNEI